MSENTRQQALSHFAECANINSSIHALKFRANDDPQLKALLPLIIPRLEDRINKLADLAISQWQSLEKTG